MLSVTNKPIMVSVNMLNAIMLNVIVLSVVTPYFLLLWNKLVCLPLDKNFHPSLIFAIIHNFLNKIQGCWQKSLIL